MRRVAVFIDAGYFWVQGCNLSFGVGQKAGRADISLDYDKLRESLLAEVAKEFPGANLLRIYWYDGPGPNGIKTTEHRSIDLLNDFKLRLGTRNGEGTQKGVDGLFIADLISLTQYRAITDALLVTGDGDIGPGVVAAQAMGLRVHLLSIGEGATSPYLLAEVDFKQKWEKNDVGRFARPNGSLAAPDLSAPPALTAPDAEVTTGEAATTAAFPTATGWAHNFDPAILADMALKQISNSSLASSLTSIMTEKSPIPPDVDRKLLGIARKRMDRDLREGEKRTLRSALKSLVLASIDSAVASTGEQ